MPNKKREKPADTVNINLEVCRVGMKGRLVISFAIIICLTAAVGVYAAYSLQTVNSYLQMMAGTNLTRMTTMQETVSLLEGYQADIYKLLWERKNGGQSSPTAAFTVKDLADKAKEIDEHIDKMKKSARESQAENVTDIENTWQSYKKAAKERIIDANVDDNAGIEKSLSNTGDMGQAYSKLMTLAEEFKQLNEGYVNIVVKDGDAQYKKAAIVMTVGVTAVILVTILIAVFFGRYINKFIRKFLDTAARNATGDLRAHLDFKGKNEFAKIADSYNGMLDDICILVGNIKSMAKKVVNTAGQITEISAQSSEVVNQVAAAASSSADSVERQVKNINDTASLVDNIADSIENMVQQAKSSADEAAASAEIAAEGSKSIGQTRKQMESISVTNSKLVEGINSLGQNSEHIAEIVDTIKNIARQTNLLALNAAIEASRAGQYGKGFAVVADEVRRLAEQSQTAAKQIEKIINNICTQTSNTVQIMTINSREVDAGAVDVKQLGESFERLAIMNSKMSGKIEMISSKADVLSGSSQNVVESVGRIKGEIDNVNDQIQSTSASIEEQSASLEEIVTSSKMLVDIAQSLTGQISKFRI